MLLGNVAGLTGYSVDLQLDGIHAVIALTIDVTGDASSVQTAGVSVTYRTTPSAAWITATVLQVL